jgi:hypothetical protein
MTTLRDEVAGLVAEWRSEANSRPYDLAQCALRDCANQLASVLARHDAQAAESGTMADEIRRPR